MLLGRESERRRIECLLDAVKHGQSDVLVLSGEAEIGKTALLRYAVDLAESMTVVTATGLEAEAELEFSGLLELCRPILEALGDIPDHQATALRGALGLSASRERDRFAVGAATFELSRGGGATAGARRRRRRAVARRSVRGCPAVRRPPARRLDRDRVGFVFAIRESEAPDREPHGFETISLSGLALGDTRELLARTAAQSIPDAAAARLHAATGGNPLALIELPAVLTPEQLVGESPVAEPLPAGRSVQDAYLRRVRAPAGGDTERPPARRRGNRRGAHADRFGARRPRA